MAAQFWGAEVKPRQSSAIPYVGSPLSTVTRRARRRTGVEQRLVVRWPSARSPSTAPSVT
jgi:hypothetical protein